MLSSPRRSSSSSNLHRSSRISQRIEKVGSTGSTVKLNNGDASIFVDNSKGQRRRGTGRMLQKFLMGHAAGSFITETIFSQNIKGGSSATNQVSAQPSSTLQTLFKSVQEKLITNVSTVNFSCPSNFLSIRNFCWSCNPLRQLSRNTY